MSINYLNNEYCYRSILLLLILSMFYSRIPILNQVNLKLIINSLHINEIVIVTYFWFIY